MNKNLMLIALSMFTWGIGEGMYIYYQPLYLQQLGADPIRIGAILGGMGIVMAITQLPAGLIGDKFGRRPVMWASWFIGTISTALMAFAPGLGIFTVGILLYAATAFVMPPMNAYITHARGNWTIGRALTSISAAYNLGAVIGPMAGGVIAEELGGIRPIYYVSLGIFVVSTIMILFIGRQPVETQSETPRMEVLKNSRFIVLLVILFFTILTTYLPQPLTANFLHDFRGVDLGRIGTLGAIGSLGNAMLAIGLGAVNARAGYLGGQVAVLLASLIIWKGTGLPWYMLGYFFLGAIRICKSLVMALTRPIIHPSQMGIAYGILETVASIAMIISPVIAGWIYTVSPEQVFVVAAVSIAIVFMVSLKFLPHDRYPSAELIITPERD